MCGNSRITINYGERRMIFHTVWLQTGGAFTVDDCTWSLVTDGEEEAHGNADVTPKDNKFVMSALIEPEKRGYYQLEFSYHIAEEIFKPSVIIVVR